MKKDEGDELIYEEGKLIYRVELNKKKRDSRRLNDESISRNKIN
jgi:hypothetical protein